MGKDRLTRVVAPSAIRRIRISSFGAFQGDRETAADWQESFPRAGNREQRRAIDLGNIHGAATSRRPFNGDVVAGQATHIKIAFQRIGLNCFSGTLAHLAKRPEWANGFYAELFFEFAPGRGFGVFSIVQLPLWDRLGAKIAVTPKGSARMDQQNINARVATSGCRRSC
jgi:hypothetical protein